MVLPLVSCQEQFYFTFLPSNCFLSFLPLNLAFGNRTIIEEKPSVRKLGVKCGDCFSLNLTKEASTSTRRKKFSSISSTSGSSIIIKVLTELFFDVVSPLNKRIVRLSSLVLTELNSSLFCYKKQKTYTMVILLVSTSLHKNFKASFISLGGHQYNR